MRETGTGQQVAQPHERLMMMINIIPPLLFVKHKGIPVLYAAF